MYFHSITPRGKIVPKIELIEQATYYLSGAVKGILDRFFVENNYLETYLGREKAIIARKMLKISDSEVLLERKR